MSQPNPIWKKRANIAHFVSVFCFLLLISSLRGQAQTGTLQKAGKVYALVIATGKVPPGTKDATTLRAPQNDGVLVTELLAGRFGVPPDHIFITGLEKPARKVLSCFGKFVFGAEFANRQAILEAFDWLKKHNLSRNDRICIYYSGHGSILLNRNQQTRDAEGFNDEALVPDGAKNDSDLIIDDEISRYFDTLKSQDVVLIADCCLSGGLLKHGFPPETPYPVDGEKDRHFVINPLISLVPRSKARNSTWADLRRSRRTLLAACLNDELAPTVTWHRGGPSFSPFTVGLCRYLWRIPGTVSWDDLANPHEKMGLKSEILQVVGLLGARGTNPLLYRPSGQSKVFLVSTPGYQPLNLLLQARAKKKIAPVGHFILREITGRDSRISASLPMVLRGNSPQTDWFQTR